MRLTQFCILTPNMCSRNVIYECKKCTSIFYSVDILTAHNYNYCEKTYKNITEMYGGEEVEVITLDGVQPVTMDLINEEDLLEESTTDL